MTYQLPGVYVREIPAQTQVTVPPTSTTAVFLGSALRGPSNPTLITSWSNYTTVFGPLSDDYDLGYAVYNYFANGGGAAYVSRVSNATAIASAVTFSGTISSTTTTLFALTAKSVGTWATSTAVNNGLRATITFDRNTCTATGTSATITGSTVLSLSIEYNGLEVERWQELSLDPASGRYIKDVLNLFSSYVTCGNPVTIPSGSSMVVTVATGTYSTDSNAFTGGGNGTAPANDSERAIQWYNTLKGNGGTLQGYDNIKNPLLINFVGQVVKDVVDKALLYASERGDSFVIIDCGKSDEYTTASGRDYGTATTKGYGAAYFPALLMGDPARSGPASLRTCFPGGAVAGAYVRSENTRGVAKAPAGFSLELANVYGLSASVTATQEGELYTTKGTNVFRSLPGGSFVINGARTLSTTRANKYITVRRSLNFVKSLVQAQTEFAVFEPNDSRLWDQINNRLSAVLTGFWASGNLKGGSPTEAFYIVCDSTNNTPATIEDGFVNVEVGVALLSPAEFIVININQWSGTNA
jgi:phage tail sheath protein FI